MSRRITIITKEIKDEKGTIIQNGSMIFRVPRAFAASQVREGKATYSSKAKFKSVTKRSAQVARNMSLLKASGIKLTTKNVLLDPTNGKVLTRIKRTNRKTGEAKPSYLIVAYRERELPLSYQDGR